MEQMRIDEIARRLFAKVPEAARHMQADLEENFRAVLRASLARLDLVTRDDFDVQTKVLERTRSRLEALEARVREGTPLTGEMIEGLDLSGRDLTGAKFAARTSKHRGRCREKMCPKASHSRCTRSNSLQFKRLSRTDVRSWVPMD